ncbi:uncharacterized protein LOC124914006 [Impatiens glandulifera]|uniref:uncharacterized protein LOC124914006 n=1 Tax=Impatiens glandulifera TaxID=253017 RepID=UPI001FB0FCB2|nr:uncharacterized protein LOC124914006 [Impatiens glandulifera]
METSSGRAKTSGWAAFGLKQQQRQLAVDDDPYPPISGAPSPIRNNLRNHRPISSISPSVKSPSLSNNRELKKPLLAASCSSTIASNEKTNEYEKLKENFSWVDKSLLDDVLATVEYDVDQAYASLNAMFDSVNDGKININQAIKPESFGESIDLEKKNDDDSGSSKLFFARWDSIPIEPEWEEDDIYYVHRKDAMKMMRSASQHSKAAQNAYLRGDHILAQQLSLKAKEEWMASKSLNNNAAKEILNIRNKENNLWKIDLHGLHASEAVEAVEDRLKGLESHNLPLSHSVSLNDISQAGEELGLDSASTEFARHTRVKKLYELNESSSLNRPTTLHVITGKGSHSRGEASIPIAVRNFLNDNGYRYDDTRPGMMTVWPKIHRQRKRCDRVLIGFDNRR